MEKLEICIGHITGRCPECLVDEKNKECLGYKPIIIRSYEIVEVIEGENYHA